MVEASFLCLLSLCTSTGHEVSWSYSSKKGMATGLSKGKKRGPKEGHGCGEEQKEGRNRHVTRGV